jgi:hypothetical protein
MGHMACTEPQCLYKGALYFTLKHLGKWQNGNWKDPFSVVWNIKEANVIIHCELKISYEWASWSV